LSIFTWCGLGGGKRHRRIERGLNWDVPDWGGYGLYERMKLKANYRGRDTNGTNWAGGQIDSWANDTLVCEARA
jgi:hypothetical protein